MKIISRILLALLLLTGVGLLFRGWLYRHVVTYKSVGVRANYPVTSKVLVAYLHATNERQSTLTAAQIVAQSLDKTSNKLRFTSGKNDKDPNRLVRTRKAHCVGYAAFFATTCNFLLQQNGLGTTWQAEPRIGQLYFLGINVHQYFNSPFFKDHDFVVIENKKTGQTLAVDPTVNDYLAIDFVAYSK